MMWLIFLAGLLVLIGVTEKSDRATPTRVRSSRVYQGGRRRVIGVGSAIRGRPVAGARDQRPADLSIVPPADSPITRRARSAPLAYTTPPPAAPNGASPTVAAGGVTVDFFQGLLTLLNAPYEGPADALRQLRALAEAGRQWNNGLIRLHQRMADRGDMRIDPFVSDHVVRAAAFGQAMVLELVESDTAMTALLNMTLAEITERGLQVPNTR